MPRSALVLILLLAPVLLLADPPESASPDVVEQLLERHRAARESKDATRISGVLSEMTAYRNEEFRRPALDGMRYRASSVDRKRLIAEARP